MSSSSSGGPPGHPSAPDDWQATRAQTALATQFLRNQDDYLDGGKADIGRQIGANERELFVSCEPALAMQQQFEHLHPEFIAVHDIGTASSRKLLLGLASASGGTVQQLVIRRQGYGTQLAKLEYIELPTSDGSVLRMYTTETDADTAARHGLARVLLAYSRLGVLMVGDLPTHAMAAALKPLHDDIVAGPWPNRQLLLLPLALASTLVTQGQELARGTSVNVRTTPQVARPADAWGFISSTWSRLQEPNTGGTRWPAAATPTHAAPAVQTRSQQPISALHAAPTRQRPNAGRSRADLDTQPMPLSMRPMPAVPGPRAGADPLGAGADVSVLQRYVQRLSELTGMVSCCVFEVATGQEVAHAGASPGATDLAMHGAELLASMVATSRTLGLGHALPEAAITLGSHHLLLRAVPRHPGLALHAVLDKTHANLTLARLQVLRMDTLFDDVGTPTQY